tara:strand:+ start:5900 stop:7927 length:2028 start_codon:yes stop_codon:yes gene_type:complete
MTHRFNYEEAFSRTLGWITERERELLRHKKVAVAGMGGVGGAHVLTLARMGITRFHISDMDVFDLVNFNRQAGAFMHSLGRPKVEVMAEMIHAINPESEVIQFPEGVTVENVDDFLEGVDLFVDGFDFFVMDIRCEVFRRCHERGIPALTAAPVGMGTSLLAFLPGKMSFEDYFRLDEEKKREDKYVKFLIGLTPRALHPSYLVDPGQANLKEQRAPSTPVGIQLASGYLVAEAVKILLGRDGVRAAPHYQQFDAYRHKMVKGYLPFGNANPLQKIKFAIGKKIFARIARTSVETQEAGPPATAMERILDLARWAPSGDNCQPWRFERITDRKVRVYIPPIEADNPYEYHFGQPTYLSVGMMLETMRQAAGQEKLSMSWKLADGTTLDGTGKMIDVTFRARKTAPEGLVPFIRLRSVDRRIYRRQPLSEIQKKTLAAELGDSLRIIWLEGDREKWRFAKVNAMATDIRLRLQKCFRVHRKIIDWHGKDSPEGIPAEATGMDALSIKIMKWAMRDWRRMDFMNKYLGGTLLAQLQMDLLPGYFCGAHFLIYPETQENSEFSTEAAVASVEDYLKMGEKLQKFWLRATELGLVMQPSLAPLCFSYYAVEKIPFAEGDERLQDKAVRLHNKLMEISARSDGRLPVFAGRIGFPGKARKIPRSSRKPLSELLLQDSRVN